MALSKCSLLQDIPKVSFISLSFERDHNFQISVEMKHAAPIFCFHLHLSQLSTCHGHITRVTKLPDAAKQEAIVKQGSRTMTQADARHLGGVDSHSLSCLLAEQHHLPAMEKNTQ